MPRAAIRVGRGGSTEGLAVKELAARPGERYLLGILTLPPG